MDSAKINVWMTQLANLGVLIGLAVLIYEIRQTNELTLAQIEQSRSEAFVGRQFELATNEYLAPLEAKIKRLLAEFNDRNPGYTAAEAIQARAEYVLSQLDPVERERAAGRQYARYWDYENLFFQHQRGLVSDAYFNERVVPGIRQNASILKAILGGSLPTGRAEFNTYVEELLAPGE